VTVRIDCIDSEAGLAALLPDWEALWQRLAQATPFQSPAWLLAWWRQFGTGAPRILTALSGGVLIGVLPLYELLEPTCRKLLPIGIGLSDYIDALVDPAEPGAVDRLLAAIAGIPDWDECHLADLPPGSTLVGAECPPILQETVTGTVPCPVLSCARGADDLATGVPR
jgi:CelD/BcsL family acetyltransferase involved in cellulose biosynthesis